MTADSTNETWNSYAMSTSLALAFALTIAIAGQVYNANARPQPDTAIPAYPAVTGKLRVSYMLTTSRTAASEEAIGSRIDASRVQYFPEYVLVTTTNGATVLWAVDRLKSLEVTRIETDASR